LAAEIVEAVITNLSQPDSLINAYVAEIRDVHIQQDRLRFRKNLERLASLVAHEVSKSLRWVDADVTTPLGVARSRKLASQPVVCSVLRAGLAMHYGVLAVFDQADSGFVSAYRKHDASGGFHIQLGYLTCPNIDGRVLMMVDPMLATGQSVVIATNEVLKTGEPTELHVLSAIAAEEGVAYVAQHYPNAHIWAAAIDPELDDHAYILPGLGDAGDLAFGAKLQS
jgi:uracil phosphoribosyltransferase